MKGLVSISDFNLINFFKQFGFGNEYIQYKIYESYNILSKNKALTRSLISLNVNDKEIKKYSNPNLINIAKDLQKNCDKINKRCREL